MLAAKRPRVFRVAAITIVSLVVLAWSADHYYHTRSVRADLEANEQELSRDELVKLESVVNELRDVKRAWSSRVVGKEQAEEFQNRIVALARKSGCQVRRSTLGAPMNRSWNLQDSLFRNRLDASDNDAGNQVVLLTQALNVTVVGSFGALDTLLTELELSEELVGINKMEFVSGMDDGRTLQLDLELLLFDLGDAPPKVAVVPGNRTQG